MSEFGYGALDPFVPTSDHNVIRFIVRQMLAYTRTVMPVQVMAVNDGGLAVTVQPLVKQTDGNGNAFDHGELTGIPVLRLQGGKSAIIIDPVVGDIGLLAVADRDISSVKANKGNSAPGSGRRFNFADGIYLGGILNATPEQYIHITDDLIKIIDKSGNSITMSGSGIMIAAKAGSPVAISGALTVDAGSQLKRFYRGSVVHTFGVLGVGGQAVTTVSVPGVKTGDIVAISFSPLLNVTVVLKGWIAVDDVVSLACYNTAPIGSVTVVSNTYDFVVFGADA